VNHKDSRIPSPKIFSLYHIADFDHEKGLDYKGLGGKHDQENNNYFGIMPLATDEKLCTH
jgi:hypothetical protein